MSSESLVWDFEPGQSVNRTELLARFGGRIHARISPSKQSPNVFLFTNPVLGEKIGFFDGWQPDGCFHFSGEGREGDQCMTQGNKAIFTHESDGRTLRVFEGLRTSFTYVGEFQLDPEEPFYLTDAVEHNHVELRQIIVFKLRPVAIGETPRVTSPLAETLEAPVQEDVPIFDHYSESTFLKPSVLPGQINLTKRSLIYELRDHLIRRGHDVVRKRIVPPGEKRPLFTSLYDATTGAVIEATGTVERGALRLAIGHLLDCARFVDGGKPSHLAVVVPSRPRQDLLDLLASQDIAAVFPHDGTFVDTLGGKLTGESLAAV